MPSRITGKSAMKMPQPAGRELKVILKKIGVTRRLRTGDATEAVTILAAIEMVAHVAAAFIRQFRDP